MIKFLESLPLDSSPEFTNKITEHVSSPNADIDEGKLEQIIDKHPNTQIRFAAFYTLVVLYRRFKDNGKIEVLANKYGQYFCDKPLWMFIMSTIYKNKGGKNDIAIALQYSEEAIRKTENYPGYLNNYAEIVAYALEEGHSFKHKDQTIDNAFTYINHAIRINSGYAKYYCTLGRLQYTTGDYQAGKSNIIKAIDLEDKKQSDYAIRIADYQYFLLKCSSFESISSLKVLIQDVQNSLNVEKIKIIEFLGFFTAVISFIISTVQIAKDKDLGEATSLILVMLGGLLIAFGAFRTIIRMDRYSLMISIVFFVFGCGIILLSLILRTKFSLF